MFAHEIANRTAQHVGLAGSANRRWVEETADGGTAVVVVGHEVAVITYRKVVDLDTQVRLLMRAARCQKCAESRERRAESGE
jgi:hypothetical protein